MATVKVKFRSSSVPGKEGTLYYHLIHQRSLRWNCTDYHVFSGRMERQVVGYHCF